MSEWNWMSRSTAKMTPEEVNKAIGKAEHVFAQVPISISHDGSAHHLVNFRISKEHAIAAMSEIRDPQYVPNVDVSEDGTTVTLGKQQVTNLAENFSHFENNNGNF